MQLNKTALGLAAGILCGACVFLATLWIVLAGGSGQHMILLNRFYMGYSVSFLGAVIGFVWGFVDGFIGGWLFALLYNLFAKPKTA